MYSVYLYRHTLVGSFKRYLRSCPNITRRAHILKALEHILVDQQAILVKELENHVLKCIKDQNGNHVIQKAIERVPSEYIRFIIDAFFGHAHSLATHAYGCRVIQRLVEHCEEPCRSAIMRELHSCAQGLVADQFGNYVSQHIIEHGSPEDRRRMIDIIRSQLLFFSSHKFASNVVEKSLIFADDEQRQLIMFELIRRNENGEGSIMKLIRCGYGNYVLRQYYT